MSIITKLYTGDGTEYEIGASGDGLAVGKFPLLKRRNIVHTAAVAEGESGYFQAGLLLKNVGNVSSATFNWSVDINGTATKIGILLENSPGTAHDYVAGGGEQSFSDTFTIPSGSFVLWTNLVTTEGDAKNATSRVFKIANLPEGIELVGTGHHWYIALGENTLTYDEAVAHYPYYNCEWNNRRYMAFGDSITQGVSPYYVSIVGEKLQCLATINNGHGGSSMTDLAGNLDTHNYVGMDLITIAHGVNGSQPLGEIAPHGSTFDINTFIGATQYVIERIQTRSPNSRIVLITPIASGDASAINTETTGRRKALHEVADDYGLTCISGTEIISDANKSQYLSADKLHPNAAGQEHYGVELAKLLAMF